MKKALFKKHLFNIVLLLILCNATAYSQKIPITSKSEEAIKSYKQGWELENTLKIDEAELAYKKAILLDSTFALGHLRLGMIRDNYNYRKKKLKDALQNIDAISIGEKLLIKARVDFYMEGYDGSKEYNYFKELVSLYPEDEVANYFFGYVNLHHGGNNPELAIKHYKKAIEINPNYTLPYNELAYAYMANANFVEAKYIAKKYVQLLPDNVNPLDTYAEIFMRSGDFQESIENYEKVLKIDYKFPWAIMGITANLNFLNKHEQGRKFLEKIDESILSDYEYRHKWRALVVSFIDQGNYKEAINALENQKIESLYGKNEREPLFHIYYAFLRKTRLFFENNQSAAGLEEYYNWNSYVQKNFKNEATKKRVLDLENYYLAYAAYVDGKYNQAINFLDNYEKMHITDASKNIRGKIHKALGNASNAIELFKDTDLSNPYNQYWLAIAYIDIGKVKEAKYLIKKIAQLNERNNIDLALVRKKALAIQL
ncbi:tetratricopeptide repeat protein [Lacinutrix chionoecetis]